MKDTATRDKAKKANPSHIKDNTKLKDAMKDDILAIMELMLEYSRIEGVKHPLKNDS